MVVAGAAGGAGCTVAATALALHASQVRPTLLVDLRGDVGAVLGGVEAEWGLDEWLATEDPPPDALRRIEAAVAERLAVLTATTPLDGRDDLTLLTELLVGDERQVVVDAGPLAGVAEPLLRRADAVVVVTRLCHLALERGRRLVTEGLEVDGVVAVVEPGRLLAVADAADALGAPIVARLRWDPSVASAVDRGVFGRRVPARLRPLRKLVP